MLPRDHRTMSHRTRAEIARANEKRRASRIDDIWDEATVPIDRRYAQLTSRISKRTETDIKQRRKEMNRASAEYARRRWNAYVDALERAVRKLRSGSGQGSSTTPAESGAEDSEVEYTRTANPRELPTQHRPEGSPYSDDTEGAQLVDCSSNDAEAGSPWSPCSDDWPRVHCYPDPECLPSAEELIEQQFVGEENWFELVS